jgi:hypothetical protein
MEPNINTGKPKKKKSIEKSLSDVLATTSQQHYIRFLESAPHANEIRSIDERRGRSSSSVRRAGYSGKGERRPGRVDSNGGGDISPLARWCGAGHYIA